jgi:FkbM family methyltransferase
MTEEKSWSEHEEQKIIQNFFISHPPKHHYLVDVGACEQAISNTAALVFLGWKAIMLEPSPAFYETLKKQWAGYPVIIFKIAAAEQTGEKDFYIHSGMGHDSLLPGWYPHDKNLRPIKVQTRPLQDILQEQKVPLDFDLLSIDTEGYDKTIISHLFTKSQYRPTLVVTEITSYAGRYELFLNEGYKEIAKQGTNEWANIFFARI